MVNETMMQRTIKLKQSGENDLDNIVQARTLREPNPPTIVSNKKKIFIFAAF